MGNVDRSGYAGISGWFFPRMFLWHLTIAVLSVEKDGLSRSRFQRDTSGRIEPLSALGEKRAELTADSAERLMVLRE